MSSGLSMQPSGEFPRFAESVGTPAFQLPPGSWDTAAHVYGPVSQYPLDTAPKAFLPPEDATLQRLLGLHDHLGIDRGVLVQGTSYGRDHRCLLDALTATNGRFVGVALIDEHVSDEEIVRLHAAGVRGTRFTLVSWLRQVMPIPEARRQMTRLTDFGWSAALHLDGPAIIAQAGELDELDFPVCVDHLGHLIPTEPGYEEAMTILLRLLEKPNWWIRLSNADRSSVQDGGYQDMVEHSRRLYEAAPERTVWGMDWPHVFYRKAEMVDDAELVDLIPLVLPSPAEQQQVLVDNPRRLYLIDYVD